MISSWSGATPRVMDAQAFIDRYVIDTSVVLFETDLVQLWIVGLLPPDEMGYKRVKVGAQSLDSSAEGLICVAMRLEVFKSLIPLASLYDLPETSQDLEFDELLFTESESGFETPPKASATQDEAYALEDKWSRGEQPIAETIDFLQRSARDIPRHAAHAYVDVLKMLHNGWLDDDDASVIIPALCRCLAEALEPL